MNKKQHYVDSNGAKDWPVKTYEAGTFETADFKLNDVKQRPKAETQPAKKVRADGFIWHEGKWRSPRAVAKRIEYRKK